MKIIKLRTTFLCSNVVLLENEAIGVELLASKHNVKINNLAKKIIRIDNSVDGYSALYETLLP